MTIALPPNARLLLAPMGAGKTEAVQNRLFEVKAANPLCKVWILLPTDRQIVAFRQRLMRQRRVILNTQFFNFYTLYRELLAIGGKPERCLDDLACAALLRWTIRDLHERNELRVLGSIAHTHGLVSLTAGLINELKQGLIRPEEFAKAAYTDRQRDLAAIYTAYQARLINPVSDQGETQEDQGLVDGEGEGWVALETTRDSDRLARDVDLLIVDGYDQFSPLQAELLKILAARARETIVTLTDPGARTNLGKRFREAIARLRDTDGVPSPFVQETRPARAGRERHTALEHLSAQLFAVEPETIDPGDGVVFIEAPDIAHEAAAVMRRVKHLLIEDHCAPDDMLIALRDWPRYGRVVAEVGRAFGVPLALHFGDMVGENPAVLALMRALELHAADFPTLALLDTLRSPYIDLPVWDANAVTDLDRLASRYLIVGGRARWQAAFDNEANAARREAMIDDEEDDTETNDPPLAIDRVESLRAALIALFDGVTPPPTAPLETYVKWIDNLIGEDAAPTPDPSPTEGGEGNEALEVGSRSNTDISSFSPPPEGEEVGVTSPPPAFTLGMPMRVREVSGAGVVERDLAAMARFKMLLNGMRSIQALFRSLNVGRIEYTREDFLADLRAALQFTRVDRGRGRDGRVLVTSVTDARGLPHAHIFILGAAESVFPAPAPEDPLLLDSERARLGALGELKARLQQAAEKTDDNGLFYELIAQAERSLTLSRPTYQDGAKWVESHLWRAARAVFTPGTPIEREAIGAVVNVEDAATLGESALAAADRLTGGETTRAAGWLSAAHGEAWARFAAARETERRRMSDEPSDEYSARLASPALMAWIAAKYGADHGWSASQFADYGRCGYYFFAKRLLALEAVRPLDEGANALEYGTLIHAILEKTYDDYAGAFGAIDFAHRDDAQAIARRHTARVLNEEPEAARLRAGPLADAERAEIGRRIEAIIDADFDPAVGLKWPEGLRTPAHIEEGFGGFGSPDVTIEVGGEPIRLIGKIDRIDRVDEGGAPSYLVLDYKTGSTDIPLKQIEKGRSLQMLIYLEAARALLSRKGERGAIEGRFWHVGQHKFSGTVAVDPVGAPLKEDAARAFAAGRGHMARYAARIRAGDFSMPPPTLIDDACMTNCPYAQLCRVSVTSRRKPQPGAPGYTNEERGA